MTRDKRPVGLGGDQELAVGFTLRRLDLEKLYPVGLDLPEEVSHVLVLVEGAHDGVYLQPAAGRLDSAAKAHILVEGDDLPGVLPADRLVGLRREGVDAYADTVAEVKHFIEFVWTMYQIVSVRDHRAPHPELARTPHEGQQRAAVVGGLASDEVYLGEVGRQPLEGKKVIFPLQP